jgi:hypothetical protein
VASATVLDVATRMLTIAVARDARTFGAEEPVSIVAAVVVRTMAASSALTKGKTRASAGRS